MFRPLSFTVVFIATLVVVLGLMAGAVGWSWTIHERIQAQARDAQLEAWADTISDQLAASVGTPVPPAFDWHGATARILHEHGFDDADLVVQILIPLGDSGGRWRVAAAVPGRPEEGIPVMDPAVDKAIRAGGGPEAAPVAWFDPAGTAWRSALLTVRDPAGRQIALVEVRAPGGVPGLAQRACLLGLLLAALLCAGLGSALALRCARRERQELNAGLAGLARGDATGLGPLSGSLQQAAEEQTTRRLRQKREIADLRVQVARFQGADRTKTTLLVALCRSLRAAVDSLRSAAALLAQTRLDRTQRDYVASLQAGCGDLLTRISDVLDFALLEAECLSLDQRPLRPRLVLEEALLIIAERYAQLPIELAWHADPAVPERVIGDLPRVRQVLVNLVGLAASTAEEGTVAVQVLAEADDRLTFRISLMGVTLTAERIRLLLDGAISSDSSSDRLHGEGLGLVLGKRLAQAMGGSLSIERGADDDIELVCTLRVAPDDVAPERPLDQRPVVVAHELPATRRMIVSMLERAGAAVTAVGTYDELAALLANPATGGALVLSTRLATLDDASDGPVLFAGVAEAARRMPLVLVVHPRHRGQLSELRAAGAQGLVTMPVRQQPLLAAVNDALTGTKRDSGAQPVIPDPQERPPRVLVVEDNHVNQLVLVRMLESLGIQPELAENGLEAVERMRAKGSEPYSLILMDIMMPVMDGLDATRAIRQQEEHEAAVWIIAVTANALANDRTKCIEAGMNDYLPKPVTPTALTEAINRWRSATGRRVTSVRVKALSGHRPAAPAVAAIAVTDSNAPSDFSGLRTLARLAGQGAVSEVITCFLREVEGLRDGVLNAADDAPRLRAAAHKLKGSSGTVGLRGLQGHAAAIETAAREGDLKRAQDLLTELPALFEAGVKRLESFRDS